MPRQIDLTPQNLKVANNPNNQLGVSPAQITKLFSDLPALTLQAIETAINELLGYIDQVTGLDLLGFAQALESLFGPGNLLQSLLNNIPFVGQLIGLFTGATGGLTGLGGLGSIFGDLTRLLGNPTALGSGSPILPGISSIPLLGGLLSGGGTLLSSLIPGLDASKIISGTFGTALLQPFIDAISQGFGGGTGLNFTSLESLLAAIPGASQVLDSIVNTFLGLSGSGFSAADLIRALESIPGELISGTLNPGMASNLGAGMISNVVPELLTNPNFDTANSVIGQGVWTWDGTQGPGSLVTSVFTDAAGVLRELFANVIHVFPGQNLDILGSTKWGNSFNGGANSISLTVAKFAGNVLSGYSTLDSIAAPGASGSWTQLGGTFTVPAGVDSIFVRPTVAASATTGRVWFGGMSVKPSSSNILADLIPGAGGIGTMEATITTMWDSITSALKLFGLSGVTLSDFAGAAQDTSLSAFAAHLLSGNQQNILDIRTNKPVLGALERTTISNMTLSALGTGSTPTNFGVTQAASAMAIVRMPESDTKGIFYWRSSGNTNITSFFLNFGKLNMDGTVTHLFSSANLASQLTSGWQWQQYTFASANKIVHDASDNLVAEFQVVGTGTLTVAGVPLAWMTDNHPVAVVKKSGASRNTGASGPTSLAMSAATMTPLFSGNTPYAGFGRSDVPVGYIPADLQTFSPAGTFTWTRPTGFVDGDLVDVFVLGGGGGGQAGGYGLSGQGAMPGQWATATFVLGSDPHGTGNPILPNSTTTLTVVVGSWGFGGANPFALQAGTQGQSSTVSGTGITTLTALGGVGGGMSGNTRGTTGGGPGNQTIGDFTAFGGTDAGVNQVGVFPGGGGGSGYPASGSGGNTGKVWIRTRQAS
jgi:hypothetical protein